MINILWLAPNFNHYKARFLNHLAKEPKIQLNVMCGTGRKGMGDKMIKADWDFELTELNIDKLKFGTSKVVRKRLKMIFSQFDWIMIPAEKKNLLLFLYILYLKNNIQTLGCFRITILF